MTEQEAHRKIAGRATKEFAEANSELMKKVAAPFKDVDTDTLVVKDDESCELAVQWILKLKNLRKEFIDKIGPLKRLYSTIHSEVVSFEKQGVGPLSSAILSLTGRVDGWRKKREKELAAKAAEANAKIKLARQRQIIKLMAMGNKEEAEGVQSMSEIKLEADVQLPEAAHTVTRWHAEVTDPKALCEWALANWEAVGSVVVQFNVSVLNGMAIEKHEKLNVPGVTAVPKTTTEFKQKGG